VTDRSAVEKRVTEMDVPKTTPGGTQERAAAAGVGAAASADRCPVDHAATGSTSAKPAAPGPPAAIPATDLPGPQMHALRQIWTYWKRQHDFMRECRERYGSRFALTIRIPPKPLYVLSDAEDMRQMFLAAPDVLHTGNGSATLEKFTGQTGLAWLDEDEHKKRRKFLMPSMHGKAFERIEASVSEMAGREVATWPRGEITTLHPHIHRLTLNVIREVIFGNAPPKCWDELIDVLLEMMHFNYRVASTLMIHKMSPRAVRILTAIRPLGLHHFLELRERAYALIAEAVEERRQSGVDGDDMLSVLLRITHEDGSPLTAVEMRDEMMTIFLAGTESTASGIAWTLENLSREDAIRERLVAEIDAGETDEYLTATVYEILRLRPPVSQIIPREVMKPIEIGGVRYEPGTALMASAYLLHHNPDLYPDPYAFRPERFLGTKPGIYTWIPFGGGRTRCLGAEIGIVEMKIVLRAVLSQYELRRADPQPETSRSKSIVTVPAKGARLELRTRSPRPAP
jgi:cytochrome P450